jgi:hypothetical protein
VSAIAVGSIEDCSDERHGESRRAPLAVDGFAATRDLD